MWLNYLYVAFLKYSLLAFVHFVYHYALYTLLARMRLKLFLIKRFQTSGDFDHKFAKVKRRASKFHAIESFRCQFLVKWQTPTTFSSSSHTKVHVEMSRYIPVYGVSDLRQGLKSFCLNKLQCFSQYVLNTRTANGVI